jgi:hypothetical protein
MRKNSSHLPWAKEPLVGEKSLCWANEVLLRESGFAGRQRFCSGLLDQRGFAIRT